MIVLSEAENRAIVPSFFWTKHRNVTEGRTDGQNLSGYYSSLHYEQCGRAVKIMAAVSALFPSINDLKGWGCNAITNF